MIAAIGLYATVSIPNLRLLARYPVAAQQAGLAGQLRSFFSKPMASLEEDLKLAEPLSDADRLEATSLLCASNNLMIAALVGVLLFQGAQAYASKLHEREVAKVSAAKKSQ